MSATATKPKPRRSRLQIVEAALAKDEAALEAARARFVELAERETEAVRAAKRAKPDASPYAMGSPAQQARSEAEKLDKAVAGLEKGILALRAERDVAAAEEAGQELAEATKEAKRLSECELELRRAFGDAVAALVEPAQKLLAMFAARDELVAQVRGAALEQRVGIFGGDAIAAWQQASAPVIEPVRTFAALLEEALAASTGPRPEDGDPGRDDLNELRRRNGLPVESRYVSPSAKALAEAYPDLRPLIGERGKREGGMISGLAEAGFGQTGAVVYRDDGGARLPAA